MEVWCVPSAVHVFRISGSQNKVVPRILLEIPLHLGDRGGTVVKVLCYKSEGRWFDRSWCQWNFSLT